MYHELRRRRVIRVALFYALAAFTLVEAASIIAPEFHLPEWTVRFVVIVFALGFPFAMILAWVFDIGRQGIRRTPPPPAEDTPQKASRSVVIYGALLTVPTLILAGGLYYLSKHTIAGTNEKTFNDQNESDPIIEDLEVALAALREELHVFASSRGSIAGNLTIVSKGDEIDLRRMGAGGFGIPGIAEPDVLQFKKCDAKFILHVEKDTVWQRFNEDKFWMKHNCILTHGNGQPPRGVRRLLHRMHDELKLPLYCLLDNDPWGYYIYSVIKQGSINLAFESRRMAVPDARFIGVRARDYEDYDLSDDVKIAVDDKDIKRAKQILNYPWFKGKKEWEKEIAAMMKHGFKMEVESLLTKSISFVTETYLPEKLKRRSHWLD